MPTIALKTPQASLLSFVLIAGSERLREGETLRQCILTGPPQEGSDMEHPITLARTEHLHVEHRTNVHAHEDGIDIFISIPQSGGLSISLGLDDCGSWELSGDFGESSGVCELAKSTKNNAGESGRSRD